MFDIRLPGSLEFIYIHMWVDRKIDRMHISIFTGKMKIIYNRNKMHYQDLSLFGVWDNFFQEEPSLVSNIVRNVSDK